MAAANLPERVELVLGGAAVSLLISAAFSLDELAIAAFAAWALLASEVMLRRRGG